MSTDNKNKKPEAAVKADPQGTAKADPFPVLRNGAWECSDGFRSTDAYVAGQHEKKLKNQ